MRQLICDLDVQVRGHNLGYIENIIRLLNNKIAVNDRTIVFLFNSPVSERLHIVSLHSNTTILFITPDENQLLEECQTVISRRVAEWKLIKKYTQQHNIDDVLILELDQYQLSIGSQTTPFSVSGIYFRPHYRIEAIGEGRVNKFKYWLLRKKKLWLEIYMCRNKNLKQIFILNDQQAVDSMNQLLRPVFNYLPDPILSYEPSQVPIRETYKIQNGRRIFLVFGSIDERKNIENIFSACAMLDPKVAAQATLLVIGTVKAHYKETLSNMLHVLNQKQPDLQVIYRDQFVDNDEMETLFQECDVPLLIYRDFFVSSGLLGQAAKHNKPVLVSKHGVMAELVSHYKLGGCVSPKDIAGISALIGQLVQDSTHNQIDGQPFYLEHTPEKFLSTLLSIKDQTTYAYM